MPIQEENGNWSVKKDLTLGSLKDRCTKTTIMENTGTAHFGS